MKSRQHGLITEINMTPFVDIVLVILIVFLLTATVLMPRTFAIALPQATQGERMEKVPIIISLDGEGRMAINGVRLAQDGDFDRIFCEQMHGKEPQAIIAADKQLRHSRLIEVIDHLKRQKVQRIGIEVEQR